MDDPLEEREPTIVSDDDTPEADPTEERDDANLEADEDGIAEDDTPEDPDAESEEDEEGDEAGDEYEQLTKAELDKLRKGQMLESDYRAKTAKLSADTEILQASIKRTQDTETQVRHAHAATVQMLQSIIPPEPDMRLLQRQDGHQAFVEQQAQRNAIIKEWQNAVQAQQRFDAERQKRFEAEMATYRDAEDKRLVALKPHLSQPEKMAAHKRALQEAASAYGFTPEDFAQVADHRMLLVLEDAARGRKVREGGQIGSRVKAKLAKAKAGGKGRPAAPGNPVAAAIMRKAKSEGLTEQDFIRLRSGT